LNAPPDTISVISEAGIRAKVGTTDCVVVVVNDVGGADITS